MEFLTNLWLPILLCGIVLFFASFVAWTMMPHRRAEWKKLPAENDFINALRGLNPPPGRYSFPNANDPETRNSPELKEAWERGPCGTLIVWGRNSMGQNMLWTVVFFIVASACIAYLSWFGLAGKDWTFVNVFRMTGTAGALTYSCAGIPNAIWFKRSVPNDIIDGVVYGIITGLIFAFLWPAQG